MVLIILLPPLSLFPLHFFNEESISLCFGIVVTVTSQFCILIVCNALRLPNPPHVRLRGHRRTPRGRGHRRIPTVACPVGIRFCRSHPVATVRAWTSGDCWRCGERRLCERRTMRIPLGRHSMGGIRESGFRRDRPYFPRSDTTRPSRLASCSTRTGATDRHGYRVAR